MQHPAIDQWVAERTAEINGCTHWALRAKKANHSFGCRARKRRFPIAICGTVQVVRCVSNWSNPAQAWTLGAYHGGDAVRRRDACPVSVETKARKMARGYPQAKPDRGC